MEGQDRDSHQPPEPPQPALAADQQPPTQHQTGHQVHQHVAGAKPGKGLAVASLVLGISACVFAFVPVLGAPLSGLLSFIGIPLAIVGLVKSDKGGGSGRGLAVAGLICSLLAIIIASLWSFIITRGILEDAEDDSSQPSAQSETAVSGGTEAQQADGAPRSFDCDPRTQFIREDNLQCIENPAMPTTTLEYVVLHALIDEGCDVFLGTHYCGDINISVALKDAPPKGEVEKFAQAVRAIYGDADQFFLWVYTHNGSNFFGDYREEDCEVYNRTLFSSDTSISRKPC